VETRTALIRGVDGEAVGMQGVTMDITDRVEAELALIEARDIAENASKAKDQFLATLSHELRTPLTPVLAVSQVLESDESLPESYRGIFDIVRRNVELEARLIDDLLDLTRITRGKLQLSLEPVALHSLIGNVQELVGQDVEEKKITLNYALDAKNDRVMGDSARLQQVLWNLIKNAVKFTSEGGCVDVRTSNGDHTICVEVHDNGIGIEPESMPSIFNAF
jgi:signal transduction histidine kinase